MAAIASAILFRKESGRNVAERKTEVPQRKREGGTGRCRKMEEPASPVKSSRLDRGHIDTATVLCQPMTPKKKKRHNAVSPAAADEDQNSPQSWLSLSRAIREYVSARNDTSASTLEPSYHDDTPTNDKYGNYAASAGTRSLVLAASCTYYSIDQQYDLQTTNNDNVDGDVLQSIRGASAAHSYRAGMKII